MPPPFPMFERPMVLIDLDDTLCDFTGGYKGWRSIGPPRTFAQEFVRAFRQHDWVIILWTTRPEIGYVREWLHEHNFYDDVGQLLFDHINNNPANATRDCNPCKPLADVIIDNACWPWCGRPVPLQEVLEDMLRRGILNWKEKRWNPNDPHFS